MGFDVSHNLTSSRLKLISTFLDAMLTSMPIFSSDRRRRKLQVRCLKNQVKDTHPVKNARLSRRKWMKLSLEKFQNNLILENTCSNCSPCERSNFLTKWSFEHLLNT